MIRTRHKAQSMAEFALLLAVVAAAITSMTIYVRRSMQARYHQATKLLVQEATKGEHQYEPYYTREAFRDEKQKGNVTTGWGTISVVDMTSEGYGWEHIPLPERWSK